MRIVRLQVPLHIYSHLAITWCDYGWKLMYI